MSGQDYIQLTLFQEDSPASHFLMPGSAEARKMTVTSGQKWLGLSRNSGPLGLLEKMLLESSIWHSTQCYLTWRARDTPHGHFLYQLVASTPRTSDTGQRLWPTPKTAIRGGLPVRKETKKSRFVSGSEDVSNTDCTGLQTSRAKQQATGAPRNGEDVPNSNGTGCQKLNLPGITDTTGLTSGGNNEGKVCNTTGQGLPDRPSQPMERYKTQEPESQRSDCHVPYSDNGSWTLWRDRELSAVKEIAGQWSHNGGGAQEYVTREWWAVEPNVGRVANGVPHRVDRLKCLGNAVVPQQFYPIFKAIAEIETEIQN